MGVDVELGTLKPGITLCTFNKEVITILQKTPIFDKLTLSNKLNINILLNKLLIFLSLSFFFNSVCKGRNC